MSEWQPIETAPKDGTPAMFLSPEGQIGIGIIQTSDYGLAKPSYHGTAAWIGIDGWCECPSVWMGGYSPLAATHWMPLPESPVLP